MKTEQLEALKKSLIRWFLSAVVVVAFLHYQSAAPWGAILAGLGLTLLAVIITTLFWNKGS